MTTTTFDTFDVVEVPFPFSDLPKSKMRKALVLTPIHFNEKNGATTLIMITSRANSEWAGDVELIEWAKAGLKKSCYIRLKFFTSDNSLILRRVGSLEPGDRKKVVETLLKIIPSR